MFERKILEKLIFDKKNEYKKEGKMITRKEIASEIGIPLSTLDVILNETKQIDPRSSTVEKIADYFGVSLDYLFGRKMYPLMYKTPSVHEKIEEVDNENLLQIIYENQKKILEIIQKID